MNETSLPRWSVRLDASRPASDPGFSDLIPVIGHHYQLHVQAADFLGPYNAKQRATSHYTPPDKEMLKQFIKQGRVNDFTYFSFLNSLVRFCEKTKGLRAVPTPHPSVIHSIQLPIPAFSIEPGQKGDTIISIIGIKTPVIVKGLRNPGQVKFIIIRPRLSQLGTASAKNWEVLFFNQALGYIPEWADTQLNPRWSGTL